MNTYRFASYSRHIGTRDDTETYAWCVYLAMSKEQLAQVSEVEYALHPSFPDPVRIVRDREHCFALQSQGWGEFTIHIKVKPVNGDLVRVNHPLELADDAWPRGRSPQRFENATEEKVYAALIEGTADWRKLSTICRWTALDEAMVKGACSALEARRAVRKAYFRSLDDDELWGATARVGLLPEA